MRITLIYAIIGILWILLSDRLVGALVTDPRLVTTLSIAKGWLYVLLTAWLLYALIQRDVSAIRRSEAALEKSERRFRLAIDNFPYSLIILDPDLSVRYANAEALRLSGNPESLMVGRHLDEVFPPDVSAQFAPTLRQVVETKAPLALDLTLSLPTGPAIMVVNFIPVLEEDSSIAQVLAIAYDITERRMAEQRRRELEEQQREFYRRTILAATEGKLLITDRQEIERVAGPPVAVWEIQTGEDLSHIRQDIEQTAITDGMDRDRVFDFVLVVGEATTNAYKHAEGGTASLHRVNTSLMIVVSDQGHGMEELALPDVALKRGYSTAKSLGMGYKAILSIADKVYLATGPTGTTVGIQMGLHEAESGFATLGLPDTWTLGDTETQG